MSLDTLDYPGEHFVSCDGCSKKSFSGVRHKCVECTGYDLCGTCFAAGKESKNHKKTHKSAAISGFGNAHPLILAYLKSKDLKIALDDPQKRLIFLKFGDPNTASTDFTVVVNSEEWYVSVEVTGTRAPMDKLTQVAEYLTRANYGMIQGRFVLDHSDGDLRFKVSFLSSGLQPKVLLVHFGIAYDKATAMYKRYMARLDEVLRGEPPGEVVKRAESF